MRISDVSVIVNGGSTALVCRWSSADRVERIGGMRSMPRLRVRVIDRPLSPFDWWARRESVAHTTLDNSPYAIRLGGAGNLKKMEPFPRAPSEKSKENTQCTLRDECARTIRVFVSFLLQQNNTVRVVSPFSNWFTRHEDKREKKKYCIYRLTAGLAWIYGGGSARARPKAFPPTHTEEKNK